MTIYRERNGYEVRVARPEDAEEIARLSGELGYPTTPEDIASRLPALLTSDRHLIAVAAGPRSRLGGWLVAERRLALEMRDRVEITGLIVDASVRRDGIGVRLIAAAEQWAVHHELPSIFVRSNVARLESHPFYEKLGFVRKKTQHAYEKRLMIG